MKKDEIVDGIIRFSGINKANVNRFYESLVELAKKKLAQDGEFVFPGLGVLKVKTRQPREGRNPKTGEKIKIKRKRVVRFGMFKDLKERLNPAAQDREEETDETGEEKKKEPDKGV